MSNDSDNSSNHKECELFVAEAASFDRIYHNMDVDSEPKSLIFRAGSPVNRAQSLEQLLEFVTSLGQDGEVFKKTKTKQGSFLGFLTKQMAEKEVTISGQFATYYLVNDSFDSSNPPDDSNITLNLYVCYLNTHHSHRHYPIIKKPEPNSSRVFFQLAHYDLSKSSDEPIFTSIKCLLKHYTEFVYVQSISDTGELSVEVFPN